MAMSDLTRDALADLKGTLMQAKKDGERAAALLKGNWILEDA